MREVPKKRKKKNNKAVFVFVIILILLTVFLASFIISYNLMNKGESSDTPADETKVTDDYEQPGDMLGGGKSDSDDISSLKLENAELKSKVSSLESENAALRRENQSLQAAIDNQKYVTQHSNQSSQSSSSQSSGQSSSSDSGELDSNSATSETGL